MKANAICPISTKKTDESVARFNAAFTVILLVLYLHNTNIFIIGFLTIDFLLRAFELSAYSPLTQLSRLIVRTFKIGSKHVNAGPKIFAARIGLVFSVVILLSTIFNWYSVAHFFTLLFGICALLESVFAFCVACKIYPFVYHILYNRN